MRCTVAKTPKRKAVELRDQSKADLRWWLQDEPHRAVFDVTRRIDRHLRQRQSNYLSYACLYDDSELASLVGGSSAFVTDIPDALTANIVRRQVDTYVAKQSKNRPVPMALTSDGNYGQKRRAKQLSKFFEGVLSSVGYFTTRPLRIRDSAIFGSGFAHNYRVGIKLVHERVFPWELTVDPREGMRGRPRSLYRHTLVDKLVLMERYPEFEEEIDQSETRNSHSLFDMGEEATSNLAFVREAWHLPSAEEMKQSDGAHVICVSNATLSNRVYKRDYFPFSKNTFSPGLVGYFGEGMVKGLAPVQNEINEIAARLQEAAYLTGSYVWVPEGSGIETDVLDNNALTLIRSALKPDFFQPNFASSQLLQYFDTLRTRLPGEITGQSGMSTRGEVPQGIESGKAIRTFHQLGDEVFTPQGREDERDCIDTALQLLDLMEEIHEESKSGKGKSFRVAVERRMDGRSFLEELDYAKVRLDRESYTLAISPVSFLSTTPEDRWSQVKEMMEIPGLLERDEVLSLLDFPDIQSAVNQKGAPRKVVERIIERILDTDDPKPIYPEPTMNLDLCVGIGTLAYLHAKWIEEAPEANTSVLLDFVIQAKNLRDGTGGPQAGSQDPNAPPPDPGLPPVNQPGAPPPGPPMPPAQVLPQV
ncbi:MAG: hypothetical protein JWM82_3349 [Myxococcales bacterium]|nr:hypothetical protein [Myxococcales bacterium]